MPPSTAQHARVFQRPRDFQQPAYGTLMTAYTALTSEARKYVPPRVAECRQFPRRYLLASWLVPVPYSTKEVTMSLRYNFGHGTHISTRLRLYLQVTQFAYRMFPPLRQRWHRSCDFDLIDSQTSELEQRLRAVCDCSCKANDLHNYCVSSPTLWLKPCSNHNMVAKVC